MSHFAQIDGRFSIECEIGRGGDGIVYRGWDHVQRQRVAIKVFSPFESETESQPLESGWAILQQIHHPGLVRIDAFGRIGTERYIAMEWLDGEDLAHRQTHTPVSPRSAIAIAAEVADALAAVHVHRLVHRDIKPSNIFLQTDPDGATEKVKIIDFSFLPPDRDGSPTRTILGTPAYMAPEQMTEGGKIDARTDLYALGVTLFELITGQALPIEPFLVRIGRAAQTLRASERMDGIPPALDDLIAQLMSHDPKRRPRHAHEVSKRLQQILIDYPHLELFRASPTSAQRPAFAEERPPSSSPKQGSRLVTSLVATGIDEASTRTQLLAELHSRQIAAKEFGHGIAIHFGLDRSTGEEALQAIEIGWELAAQGGQIGIATGRMQLHGARAPSDHLDDAVLLAHSAKRGEVAVDEATQKQTKNRVQFASNGSAAIAIKKLLTAESKNESPFVGRDRALQQLEQMFACCMEEKIGQSVLLCGAQGMGKSRLAYETSRRVSNTLSPRTVFVRCESIRQKSPLGVMADIARLLFAPPKSASKQSADEAITHFARATDLPLSEQTQRALTSLITETEWANENAARDDLWIAMTSICLRASKLFGLFFTIQEIQWVDSESLLWLEHLCLQAKESPFFFLATARPEFCTQLQFISSRIDLEPLSHEALEAIAAFHLPPSIPNSLRSSLVTSIAQQAAGSPLFAEELALSADRMNPIGQILSLEAVVQVHFDTLSEEEQTTLIHSSVLGMRGWDRCLEAFGLKNGTALVDRLVQSRLAQEADSRFAGTREYTLKNPLLRDYAYGSIPSALRITLHRKAAEWLLAAGEDEAVVARHFELGKDFSRAADALEHAAIRALSAHALADAVAMADKSLGWTEEIPIRFRRARILDEAWSRLDARAAERANAIGILEESAYDAITQLYAEGARARYTDACGLHESIALLEQATQKAREMQRFDEEARSTAVLASRLAFAGKLEAAWTAVERLHALAQNEELTDVQIDAEQTRAVIHQARGQLGAALSARRSAASAAQKAGLKARQATLTLNIGFALITFGAKEEARSHLEIGIALAQTIGSYGIARHGRMLLLAWAAAFGSDPELDRELSEMRAHADASIGSWTPQDRTTLGILFYRGAEFLRSPQTDSIRKGGELLRMAEQGYRATQMYDLLPSALALLSDAERRLNHLDEAYAFAREAVERLDQGPSLLSEAPAYLALYDACIARGAIEEGRNCIDRGFERVKARERSIGSEHYASMFRSGDDTQRLYTLAKTHKS